MTIETLGNDIEGVRAAYLFGATADLLRAKIEGQWKEWWTVPPCSPAALEQAGQQMTRGRAQAVVHVRQAVLKNRQHGNRSVVVVTELPGTRQVVVCLKSGSEVRSRYLEDELMRPG